MYSLPYRHPYSHPQPQPYQWQSTDWQVPEFLARQNMPMQQTVTREVPPMPRPGFNPQVQQMQSGTPGLSPYSQDQNDYPSGRIAGGAEDSKKNICITLNINLGGDSDEPEQQRYIPYREQAPSWHQ